MADQAIGDVLVVEPDSDGLVWIVTDRDLAIRALAKGLGPSTKVEEIAGGASSRCRRPPRRMKRST